MKRVLLTGAAGYIGRNFKHYTRFNDDIEITDIDTKVGKNIFDLKREDLLGITDVVHFAANINIKDMEKNPKLAIENFQATKHLCELIRQAQEVYNKDIRIIFSSSCQAMVCQNIYGLTKFSEEALIELLCPNHAIIRFFNVVGGDVIDDSNNDHILPNIMNSIINKTKFKIYGDPTVKRSYVHVNRICEGVVSQLDKVSRTTTHLVTKDLLSIEDVVTLVGNALNMFVDHEKIDHRLGDYPEIVLPKEDVLLPAGDMKHAILDFAKHFKLLK